MSSSWTQRIARFPNIVIFAIALVPVAVFAWTLRHTGPEGVPTSEMNVAMSGFAALAPLQVLWAYSLYREARRQSGSAEKRPIQFIAIVSVVGGVLGLIYQGSSAAYGSSAEAALATPLTIAIGVIGFATLFCAIALYWNAASAVVQAEAMGPQYELRESLITTVWIAVPLVGILFFGRRLSKLFMTRSA